MVAKTRNSRQQKLKTSHSSQIYKAFKQMHWSVRQASYDMPKINGSLPWSRGRSGYTHPWSVGIVSDPMFSFEENLC